MRSKQRLLLVVIPATLLLAVACLVIFSAQRTLTRTSRSLLHANQLPFSFEPLDLAVSSSSNPGFEPVASSNRFTCGAFFQGNLYLAGPGGLQIYAADGTLRRALRTGLELPVAPIVRMAVARLRGASAPELLLATAGAGLLLLDPSPDPTHDLRAPPALHQLLARAPGLRDLTALAPLASGDLLLGTRHDGVLLFNGTSLTPLRFALDGTDATTLQVTSLATTDTASLLIGTRNQGLFFVQGGTAQHVDTASGLPDEQVDAIATVDGRAFAGTPRGVAEFDLSHADVQPLRPTRILAPGLFSHALAFEPWSGLSGAQLIVGSLDQGIVPVRLDAAPRLRKTSIAAPAERGAPGSEGRRIDHFLSPQTPSSQLYAIADGTLLVRGSSGWAPALTPSPASPTLSDGNVSALAFDPEGHLYVGFFDRGLDILDPNTSQPVRHLEDDHLFCINRLAFDPVRGTLAAATANGLVLFDRQGAPRQVLTRRDGLISDHVTDVAFTASGTTLATAAGITFITAAGTESLYAFEGLANNHVYALAAQPGGQRLLAGTLGGLSVIESGAVRRNLTAANSALKHNWITAIAALPDGSDLIGTYGAGIERVRIAKDGSASFTPIELPAGAPRDLAINPNALLVTATHVYAGTLGHGMLVYSPNSERDAPDSYSPNSERGTAGDGRWSLITRGLPSLNVTAFAERNGELFVGTENGLVRISEHTLGSSLQ